MSDEKKTRKSYPNSVEVREGGIFSWHEIVPPTESGKPPRAMPPFETPEQAVKWIESNGEAGKTYRVVRVIFAQVEIEKVSKAKVL